MAFKNAHIAIRFPVHPKMYIDAYRFIILISAHSNNLLVDNVKGYYHTPHHTFFSFFLSQHATKST